MEMFCNSSDLHYELLFLKAIKIRKNIKKITERLLWQKGDSWRNIDGIKLADVYVKPK